MSRLFLRKSVQDCEDDILERGGLKRSLGKWHLTALGVGATIGAGIFATTGTAIVGDPLRPGAGPGDRALVPAHRAHLRLRGALLRRVRGDGADLGLGVHLRLRLAGRAGGLDHRLGPDHRVRGGQHRRGDRVVGLLPRAAEPLRRLAARPGSRPTTARRTWRRRRSPAARPTPTNQYLASASTTAPHLFGLPFIVNLPAFLIVALITVILVIGIREIGQLEQRDGAAQDRHHPVLLRGGRHADQAEQLEQPRHWAASRPTASRGSARARRSSSSATSASTPPPRPRRRRRIPARDMPFGIIMSLIVCTVLYIVLALVMTGMAPWQQARHRGADDHGARAGRRLAAAAHALAVHRVARRGDRHEQRAAGVPAGPAAHLHVDGARRPAAAVPGAGASPVQDAVHRHHHHRHCSWRPSPPSPTSPRWWT